MVASWESRVELVWSTADDSDPEALVAAMRELVAERGEGDPDALFEWASVHDFLGRESTAVPIYQEALAAGLTSPRREQALIQLGSSLRNVGRLEDAVACLSAAIPTQTVGSAAQAFLALALHDAGEHDRALAVALRALAPTLPMYGRSVAAYADALVEEGTVGDPRP